MKDHSFREFVLDQLRGLRELEGRAMFGGFGIYAGGQFFAILYQGRLYFRTSDATRGAYLERGIKPFRPRVKQRLNSYYEVPAEVLEEAAQLEDLARIFHTPIELATEWSAGL